MEERNGKDFAYAILAKAAHAKIRSIEKAASVLSECGVDVTFAYDTCNELKRWADNATVISKVKF